MAQLFTSDPGRYRVPAPQMRVSDAERSEVVDALCRHSAEGRLDEEEFAERAGRAGEAKTRADLGALLADLPPLGPPSSPSPTCCTPEVPPVFHRRPHHPLLLVAVLVLAALWLLHTISFVSHAAGPWVLAALVVALLVLRRHRRRFV